MDQSVSRIHFLILLEIKFFNSGAQLVNLQLYDALGQEIYNYSNIMDYGSASISIDMKPFQRVVFWTSYFWRQYIFG